MDIETQEKIELGKYWDWIEETHNRFYSRYSNGLDGFNAVKDLRRVFEPLNTSRTELRNLQPLLSEVIYQQGYETLIKFNEGLKKYFSVRGVEDKFNALFRTHPDEIEIQTAFNEYECGVKLQNIFNTVNLIGTIQDQNTPDFEIDTQKGFLNVEVTSVQSPDQYQLGGYFMDQLISLAQIKNDLHIKKINAIIAKIPSTKLKIDNIIQELSLKIKDSDKPVVELAKEANFRIQAIKTNLTDLSNNNEMEGVHVRYSAQRNLIDKIFTIIIDKLPQLKFKNRTSILIIFVQNEGQTDKILEDLNSKRHELEALLATIESINHVIVLIGSPLRRLQLGPFFRGKIIGFSIENSFCNGNTVDKSMINQLVESF